MVTDYYEPSNKYLNYDQIVKLVQGIFTGTDPSYATQFAQDMARISPAEGLGNTGIVVNTAFPDAPNYYTPEQYFGPQQTTPEYSLGLFGEDILNASSYNLVASSLKLPGLAAGQTQPTSAQAQSLAKAFAANPSAQAVVAYQMYQGAGDSFRPWTESVGQSTASIGPLPTGEQVTAPAVNTSGSGGGGGGGGGGSGSGSGSGSGFAGATASAPEDVFTSVMQNLSNLMNPQFGALSLINPNSYMSAAVMILVRGGFAVGFTAVAIVGLMKLASGGKVGAADLPGLVAGFVAGPEVGLANLAGKMFGPGVGSAFKPARQPTEMEQARLALGQDRLAFQQQRSQTGFEQSAERLDFQRRKAFVSAAQRQQSMMQQAERTTQQQQQFQARMQQRQEEQVVSGQQFQQRQQATAERAQKSYQLRAESLRQGTQRIQQGAQRIDLGQASLAQRTTAQRSQARARGARERRMSGIQAWREQIYPGEYALKRRKQTTAEVKTGLREREVAVKEFLAGLTGGDYDQITIDYD